MRLALRSLALMFVLPVMAALAADRPTLPRNSPNLFSEWLGKSEAEVDAKLETAWKHLFEGDPQWERVYYPVGPDMGYMADTGNEDVRTEGQSYGMMLAVQMNRQDVFNRLWKWTRTHMYHDSGPRKGYFAWHCTFDGKKIDDGSASDGEAWFIMTLLFASNRWGDGEGIFNYSAEAQALMKAVLTDNRGEGVRSIFNLEQKQITFVPSGIGSTFTDPSYHTPHFYELWALWAKENNDYWKDAAGVSRAYFHKAAHPVTGLMPEYSHFDGSPRPGYPGAFRYDAFRTLAHVAIDYVWWGVDPWQKERTERVLRFFNSQGPFYTNQYTLDGKPLGEERSSGLEAMAAAAAIATERELGQPFVQRLWEMPIPTGRYRYYDGLLYHWGLLQTSGRFRAYGPASKP